MRLCAVALVVACGHEQPPVEAPRTAYTELEVRLPALLGAMQRLATELTVSDGDCPQVAAALRRFGARHGASLVELFALRAKLTPREVERWEYEHDDDAKQVKKVFGETVTLSCANDGEVKAALQIAGFHSKPELP